MSTTPVKVKPSGAAYLLPLLAFVATSVIAVLVLVGGVKGINDTVKGFATVPATGEGGVVRVEKAGGYTLFWEDSSNPSFQPFAARVTVTKVGSDTEIPTSDYGSTTSTYDVGTHHGVAIRTVRIDSPGDYKITASGLASGEIAIGHSPFKKLTAGIAGFFIIGSLGFVFALVLVIVIAVMRGRSKRKSRAAQFGSGPPWGGQPGPGGPPGYGTPSGGGGYRPAPVGSPPGYGQPGYGQPAPSYPQPQPLPQPQQGGWGSPPGQSQPGSPGGPGGFGPPPGSQGPNSPGGFPPPPPPR